MQSIEFSFATVAFCRVPLSLILLPWHNDPRNGKNIIHLRFFDGVRLGFEGVESALVGLGLDVTLERRAVDEVFPVEFRVDAI